MMPIYRDIETVRIDQEEFKHLAYEVMNHVFAIHNEFGRFFDEVVSKRELADRLSGTELELPVTVTYGDFSKTFKLDALVHQRGLFEFKDAERISGRHRGQTINYLLLFDLAHGKIVNVRPERVESEFVNCHQRLLNLRRPEIDHAALDASVAGGEFFIETLTAIVSDWGVALELSLFEEALTHLLGGEERMLFPVPVIGSKNHLHDQKMRLLAPDVAFRLTAFPDRLEAFEMHARKLLLHTGLKAVHWANLTHDKLTFAKVMRNDKKMVGKI